ncbi:dienelactone hydrolase family protein [Pectobacterium aroidearum]|uniref:Dienelactone hydrolase family protein n=1 Tax=Pectobacterium aroidearum TaxID=1201031 RepID=A0ABR5ZAX1_9GAMM|nr:MULTISPECIES: CocE/NonD family hydrolase [Pectobacterium]MBA5198927.1 dienelactone hydrolase family protein [Pectobacterium aroidearum]MBA5226603.1 dienelactone hydrolase family protein [Pectobacterium aroidearum]MBA5231719.1 dienelactone hydrolase family protein [Pectobacterium aroidearum]MBA5736874.1 dienelactone hydrolase family protein [Pectobacterium aroidearum]QPI44493.1 dienelactone hydrolase family protein [Pectobacterium aroidearum]
MRHHSVADLIRVTVITALFCLTFSSIAALPDVSLKHQQFEGLIREPLSLQVTLNNGEPALLDAFVTRPVSQTKLPVVVITNGTVGTAEFDRWEINPNRESSTALAFARHGYAAVTVLREGYGYSSGGAEYSGGSCKQPLHKLAGEKDTRDILAALEVIRLQPWASPDKAVLAGMSAGGFAVLATSAVNPPGVQAIINFDGGRGSIDGKSLCDRAGLINAFTTYGLTARIPSLWLYSSNDQSFTPEMGRAFSEAYRSGGGNAAFIEMPAFGTNGHVFMDTAPEDFWWKTVAGFLAQQHLPVDEVVSLPTVHLTSPANLNNLAGKKAFRKYEAARLYEKAFATGKDGAWGTAYWARTGHEAADTAVRNCEKFQPKGAANCTVYAINDVVVTQ